MSKAKSNKAVRIDFANAISSRVVFVTESDLDSLLDAYHRNRKRYVLRCRHSQNDKVLRNWYLDLDGVVSIDVLT